MSLCGTPEYLAPEVIQAKPYGTSADWWSFGVMLYEFVAGYSPFSEFHNDVMAMYGKICEGTYKIPYFFAPDLKHLLENLLQIDLSKRLGSTSNGNKDIKNHHWYAEVDWNALLNKETEPEFVPEITDMEDLSYFDKIKDKSHSKGRTCRHCEMFENF